MVISNCYATGSVAGNDYVGGLIGFIYGENRSGNAVISNCYARVNVIATEDYVGGLIGYVTGRDYGYVFSEKENVCINNCYATGNVTGKNYVGGFTGRTGGFISNSFACGRVSASGEFVGGFVGYSDRVGLWQPGYPPGQEIYSERKREPETDISLFGYVLENYDLRNTHCSLTANLGLPPIGGGYPDNVEPDCTAQPGAWFKSPAALTVLGAEFAADNIPNINGGFPILKWQALPDNAVEMTLEQTGAHTLAVTLTNTAPVAVRGVRLIGALYIGERMVEIKSDVMELEAHQTKIKTVTFDNEIADNACKIFVWSDLNAIKPPAVGKSLEKD